jgi:putative GTP pyrophosphokinase
MRALADVYQERFQMALTPIAPLLEGMVAEFFRGVPRIDKITVRPKSPDSFLLKAVKVENDRPKYDDPINQVQDQIGARIVCYFNDDVEPLAAAAAKYFRPIEIKNHIPETENAFGYIGKHFIFLMPTDFNVEIPRPDLLPPVFEFQIKTLYQHAWAQADHDIAYKAKQELTPEQKRRIAFTAAQSWGADIIFNELLNDLG